MTTYDSNAIDAVEALSQQIIAFIEGDTEQSGTDEKFNELAFALFRYQFEANTPYRKYCQKRGMVPGEIDSWEQIPAVPTQAFKAITLTTFPVEQAVKLLMTSGTSKSKPGKVYFDERGVQCCDASMRRAGRDYVTPDGVRVRGLLLTPQVQHLPNSAIAFQTSILLNDCLIGQPEYFITPQGLDAKGFVRRLREVEESGTPVIILGATFGLIHFFDACRAKGLAFQLPPGSRLVDGGGYKGRSREVSKEEYFELGHNFFGLPATHMINVLGLSESSAPFPDNVLYNHVRGIEEPRYKLNPPWSKTTVVDPDTLQKLPKGEIGLLRHYCLANISTVAAVQTDDIGYQIGHGFEIIGRAKGAEARGCSIAVDEIISLAT